MAFLKLVSARNFVWYILTINLANVSFANIDDRFIYDVYKPKSDLTFATQFKSKVQHLTEDLDAEPTTNIRFQQLEDDKDDEMDDFPYIPPLIGISPSKNTIRNYYKILQKYYLPVPNRIEKGNCTKVVKTFAINLVSGLDSWALRMGDSWAKVPDGYLFGNVHLTGMYEECLQVEGSIPLSLLSNDTIDFTGKYCTIYYKNENVSLNMFPHRGRSGPAMAILLQPLPYHYATCIPSVCSQEELETSINETFTHMGRQLAKITCTDDEGENEFDGFDIFVSVLLIIIITLVIIGTISQEILAQRTTNSFINNRKPIKTIVEILCCFSLPYNMNGLFKYRRKTSNSEINCLHGIRVITLIWIITCHQYETNVKFSVNSQQATKYLDVLIAQAVTNGYPSVDTFFVLSGLLLAYRLLSSHVTGQGFGYYQAFFRRLVRLVPSIFIVASFSATLLRFLGMGPRSILLKEWSLNECRPNWWKDPLFIDNYVIGENNGYNVNDCLGHCWYTAVEMQLFLVVPFILIPLKYNFRAGLLWLIFLTAGSMAVPCLIIIVNEFPPIPIYFMPPQEHFEFMTKYYLVPWCRASPYFIGILTGIFLVKRPKKLPRLNKKISIFGCLIAVMIDCAIVFGLYPYNHNNVQAMPLWLSAFYGTFSKPFWSLSVCWVIVVCHLGCGGFIEQFLGWWGWQPLSRLSFCIYLIAPVVQVWWSSSLYVPVYFHYMGKLFEVCGVFFSSFVLSVILSVCVERPLLNIARKIASPQGIITRKETPNETKFNC